MPSFHCIFFETNDTSFLLNSMSQVSSLNPKLFSARTSYFYSLLSHWSPALCGTDHLLPPSKNHFLELTLRPHFFGFITLTPASHYCVVSPHPAPDILKAISTICRVLPTKQQWQVYWWSKFQRKYGDKPQWECLNLILEIPAYKVSC